MTRQEADNLMRESIKTLCADPRFEQFLLAIRAYQEEAVRDACRDEAMASERTLAAALGHIRAYQDIFGLVEEARAAKLALDSQL